MDQHTDADGETHEDNHENKRDDAKDRYERALRGMDKPKTRFTAEHFHGISIEERHRRIILMQRLVEERFAVEQIVAFLPIWNLKLTRAQVYEYLEAVKRPRSYVASVREQRVHDRLAINHVIRIAQDAFEYGVRMDERIEVARAIPGFRLIPDARFFLGDYGFMLEEQASPLPETRWTSKLKAHLRHFLETGDRSRRLFVVNGKADLVRARQYARSILRAAGRSSLNLFLFIDQKAIEGAGNMASDTIWQTAWGPHVGLVDWLRSGGQKPHSQHQR